MDRNSVLGYTSSFGSAICYGIAWVLIKKGVTDVAPPLVGVTLSMFVGAVALSSIEAKRVAAGGLRWGSPLLLMALSGLLYGVAHLSSFYALAAAPVIVVVALSNTYPLVTVAVAHLFMGRTERVSRMVVLGGLLTVVGAILVTIGTT